MRTLRVVSAGTVAYKPALDWQRNLHARRVAGRISDVVLLLEHPHVYTLGRRFSAEHLLLGEEALASRGIEVHECDRGGSITYHGPGQLVGYPIVALDESSLGAAQGARRGPDAIAYLRCLEEALIRAVGGFGVAAERRKHLTGVWVGEAKLASIGVNVSRGVSKHGFALNVTTDLSYFAGMIPCGIPSVDVTSLERLLGEAPPMEAVEQAVAVHLALVRGARVRTATLHELGLVPKPDEAPNQAASEGEHEGSAAVGLLGVTIPEEAQVVPFPGMGRARTGPVTAGK
jgi:lipoyl(octanoyl) transferase